MSLLVTSCTMGQQPDRLLNKGPDYLRTRTNRGLFAQHRKSAVELLAASKSQFYTGGKEAVDLDKQQDLAVTHGQSHRYSGHSKHKQKEPPRSKSDYDLSQIRAALAAEDEGDENNNNNNSNDNSSEDQLDIAQSSPKLDVLEGTERLSLHDNGVSIDSPDIREVHGSLPTETSEREIHTVPSSTEVVHEESRIPYEGHGKTTVDEADSPKLTILRKGVSRNSPLTQQLASGEESRGLDSTARTPDVVDETNARRLSSNSAHRVPTEELKLSSSAPKPLPRKLKKKPVPPPRKPCLKSLNVDGSTLTPPTKIISPDSTADFSASPLTPRAREGSGQSPLETPRRKSAPSISASTEQKPYIIRKKKSLVESLTQHFTALSAHSDSSSPSNENRKSSFEDAGVCSPLLVPEQKDVSTPTFVKQVSNDTVITYTATPIFISKPSPNPNNQQETFRATPVTTFLSSREISCPDSSGSSRNTRSAQIPTSRKRCPDVPVSNKYSKRERKCSLGLDTTKPAYTAVSPGFVTSPSSIEIDVNDSVFERHTQSDRKHLGLEPAPVISSVFSFPHNSAKIADPVARSVTSSSASKSEMSIESVDQAVCESEVNALPAAPASSSSTVDIMDGMLGGGGGADDCGGGLTTKREVTRSNSSLSGKMEALDSAAVAAVSAGATMRSHSPTLHHHYQGCASTSPSCVPRSHSDISCRLEGQHSRDSSIVSSRSRLSRASAGADLENFFNQMGLEKGVLEPIARLKELQACEVFDSVSSLDSQDAASICSTYSRSEQEWTDSQSVERLQHPTSVVERNARIIKWLCNVRKAKIAKSEAEAAGKG
ncbi:probable serine/threonine-protein kinase nek3 [Aplysia californica]|uniref:Probable serine/threonine-protein kinase nek3 n=1 Tax=Aplysia californica TaxID=6500 RepID=A0ABM1A346_APLCA|nr:probable serine/threonine-protein kinase nek3 [Aplysia californica]